MSTLVFYICLCILISFFCSLLEASLLSLPRSYVASLINQEHKAGEKLERITEAINRPLAAILSLNTVANTVGAAGVGAQVLHLYGDQYVALSSGLLTLGILVFSEIIPKTIGAKYCKPLAHFAIYVIPFMIVLTYPFVIISEKLSMVISRGTEDDQKFTRDEMKATTKMGEEDGAIKEKESIIINNLLSLSEISVKDIMTPVGDVLMYQQDITVKEVINSSPVIRYSRIPVYGENYNDITGMVLRYQIMKQWADDNEQLPLTKLINPIRSVSKGISIANLLNQFFKCKEQIFMVMDEYGATIGLVSLEDAIETLLGEEIIDELDNDYEKDDFSLELARDKSKFIIKKAHKDKA